MDKSSDVENRLIGKIWQHLRDESNRMIDSEEILTNFLTDTVLTHTSLERALAYLLSEKLYSVHFSANSLKTIFNEAFAASSACRYAIACDLKAVVERDPASRGFAEPFLHYKGFHALEAYRVSHFLWNRKRYGLALLVNNRIAEVFSVDIHPAAKIGKGIFIDHATGVVVGETAVIGDDVSLLHEVTLGGTGKEKGDRHPKIGSGVLIGAGAKILGNVKIGQGSKIGAGSVVLNNVPPHSTVVGVPARIVGHPKTANPALSMDQEIDRSVQMNLSYSASTL